MTVTRHLWKTPNSFGFCLLQSIILNLQNWNINSLDLKLFWKLLADGRNHNQITPFLPDSERDSKTPTAFPILIKMPGNIISNVNISAKKLILSVARLMVYPSLLGNTCGDDERWGEEECGEIKDSSYHHCSISCFLSDNVPCIIIKPQHSLQKQSCTTGIIMFTPISQTKKKKKSTEKVCSLYDYIDIHLVLNNALIFKRNQIALMLNPKGNQSNRLIHVKRIV